MNTFKANPFGLHHVHGNVWEWCSDGGGDFSFYSNGSVVNPEGPQGPDRNRICRGGSFYMTADQARSGVRWGESEGHNSYDLGLRPARAVAGVIR